MRFSNLLAAGIVLLTASASLAQTPSYTNVGRTPTKEEIQAWDIAAGPDGKGLPPGHGTAQEGAPIYATKCASCHGPAGEGTPLGRRLVGSKADMWTLTTVQPLITIGSYWPFATTIWDYINRAMPRNQGGSLNANEVYALTAFILSKCGIIQEGDVIDAKTLPKVHMPNHDGFIPQRFEDIPDEHKRGCRLGTCP